MFSLSSLTKAVLFFSVLFVSFFSISEPAFAVQPHGGLEGLVSHELGHVLFMGGIVFLLVQGRRSNWSGPGWDEFSIFLRLAFLWNIFTFSSHWMDMGPWPNELIVSDGNKVGFHIASFSDAYYYLTKLDHLILLPALIYLYLALKRWAAAPEESQ